MKREIKFRAWDSKQSKIYSWEDMTTGYLIGFLTGYYKDTQVMQYTGLKDKNGKEIYEGDVLKHKWNCSYGEWLETISEVKWDKGAFVVDDKKRADWLLSLHACADSWAEVEIIGNIYENPELLEVTQCHD